jgi:hypothetical protein
MYQAGIFKLGSIKKPQMQVLELPYVNKKLNMIILLPVGTENLDQVKILRKPTCVHVHTQTHTETHTHIHRHTHRHTYMYTQTHTDTHTYTDTHTQTHIHVHRDTHTDTLAHSLCVSHTITGSWSGVAVLS